MKSRNSRAGLGKKKLRKVQIGPLMGGIKVLSDFSLTLSITLVAHPRTQGRCVKASGLKATDLGNSVSDFAANKINFFFFF